MEIKTRIRNSNLYPNLKREFEFRSGVWITGFDLRFRASLVLMYWPFRPVWSLCFGPSGQFDPIVLSLRASLVLMHWPFKISRKPKEKHPSSDHTILLHGMSIGAFAVAAVQAAATEENIRLDTVKGAIWDSIVIGTGENMKDGMVRSMPTYTR